MSFVLGKLYKNAEYVEERHRHRYEVNTWGSLVERRLAGTIVEKA